jgi:dihydroneopterin aldolase
VKSTLAGPHQISLLGLRAFGRHGVLPEERAAGQEFVVDAIVWLDLEPAASTDDLTLTVNYADLAERLAGIVSGEPVNLIETLAGRLVEACLDDARVNEAEVTVHKPSAPIAVPFTDVAVTIRRGRSV